MRAYCTHRPAAVVPLCLVLLALCCRPVEAQTVPRPVGGDSLSTALVPVAGYSSDEGFIGGAVYNRIDYRGGHVPFHNYLEAKALVTTKGFVQVEGRYEKLGAFGRDLRAETEVLFERLASNNYFGVGNDTEFTRQWWDEGYYFFEDIAAELTYRLRRPLYREEGSGRRLDLIAGAGTAYHISYQLREESRFSASRPNGHEGGWVNLLTTGLVWENRDSEFDPRRGNRLDFELRFSPHALSAYDFTTAELTLRQYFRLFGRVTVAQRLEGRHAGGDVPYWELSTLGDDVTLRGYPLNRFQGRTSVSYTLELRSWIVEFPQYGVKLGGQLFTDTGRVFTGRDEAGDLFGEWHRTVGFGGAMTVFNPDFILRGDLGFSEDLTRLYIGVGYMF